MKYWVYMNGEVPGCYAPQELAGLAGFSMTTLVCPAEGEILEKNWRRSGEFADIIQVLHERDAAKAPSAPAAALEPPVAVDVDSMIDTAGARLFSHVADLMKELENRRDERALTQSVQRQLVDLKEQLTAARERSAMLETRLPRMNELEEAARKHEEKISGLEASLRAREDGLAELRMQLEKTRNELETSKRRLGEALNDLGIRNRLVDKLSRDLTEKELSLAKALGLIRRLEEDLHRLMPSSAEDPEPAAPESASAPAPVEAPPPAEPEFSALPAIPVLAPQPAAAAVSPTLVSSPEVVDDQLKLPPLPEVPAPAGAPAAQTAIVDLFKRFLSKDLQS